MFHRARRAPSAAGGILLASAILAWTGAARASGPAEARAPASKPPAGRTHGAAPAGDVVARVNGQPVLRRDFDLAVQMQFRGRRPTSVRLDELRAVRDKVLDRLIDNELLYQAASRSGSPVPDGDVEAEFARLREKFGKPEALQKMLADNQVSEAQFREQLRRSLAVTRFVDKEVTGDLKVPDEDVRLYYDQNPGEMKRSEAIRLSEILVRVPPDASAKARAAARERIEAILKELRAGGDFAGLARRHSEGPEAKNGGDGGWLPRGGGPPPIERAAFSMQPGEVSDIIETRLGYHIIKVGERRPEGVVPFDEAKASIRARILARQRDEKIQEFVGGLRQKARIERHLATAPSKAGQAPGPQASPRDGNAGPQGLPRSL